MAGRLSDAAMQLVEGRFGSAALISWAGTDSTIDLVADQPALRALLTLTM